MIVGFVGLRSKMYVIKMEKETKMKVKGITAGALKGNVNYDSFKECLITGELVRTLNRTIKSVKHKVQTIESNKITLSTNDDKRYICDDGVNTLAHGHYRVMVIDE